MFYKNHHIKKYILGDIYLYYSVNCVFSTVNSEFNSLPLKLLVITKIPVQFSTSYTCTATYSYNIYYGYVKVFARHFYFEIVHTNPKYSSHNSRI